MQQTQFDPWVRTLPWRRKWQATPVCLPGKLPWTEVPGGLQFMELQRTRHDWVTEHVKANNFVECSKWRISKKWIIPFSRWQMSNTQAKLSSTFQSQCINFQPTFTRHLFHCKWSVKWPRFPGVVWKEQRNCALKVHFWDFSGSHAMLVVLFGGRKSGIPISLILRAS